MEKKIEEIYSIGQLLQHVCDHSYIFFDLDNTLFMPIHDFGSAAWEDFMVQHFVAGGVPPQEAIDRASDVWKAVQVVAEIKFVEDHTPQIIQQLQQRGCPVLAITARSIDVQEITEKQVSFLNVHFHEILYCGKLDKGIVLQSYIEKEKCSHVVMIDDMLQNLKNALDLLTIPFVGLRYSYMDFHRKNYAPDPTTLLLGKIFSHPEACKFLIKGLAK